MARNTRVRGPLVSKAKARKARPVATIPTKANQAPNFCTQEGAMGRDLGTNFCAQSPRAPGGQRAHESLPRKGTVKGRMGHHRSQMTAKAGFVSARLTG